MDTNFITICCVFLVSSGLSEVLQEPPEGYYTFMESPNAEPPRVRRPPYRQADKDCPGIHSQNSLHNLCGDLNKGIIPRNPMGQKVLGAAYPFELVKNKTLEFFSKTLPILKADETLPRVAKYNHDPTDWDTNQIVKNTASVDYRQRAKRETHEEQTEKPHEAEEKARRAEDKTFVTTIKREARKFCENGGGVFCMLYRAFNGESLASGVAERREDVSGDAPEYRRGEGPSVGHHDPSLPPTPCPAKVDYATPVFAKNYQGVWRYVVQIPYEGYFTQTIEVTRCLQTRCHYLDGGCLSSPRWTSLLVAEIYYPDTFLPPSSGGRWPSHRNPVPGENPPPVHDFQNYQQYLHKRAGAQPATEPTLTTAAPTKGSSHCDGVDDIGCFQVRLYYDWFLIPGSCKCWRPDYFSRYIRRKNVSPDL